MSDRIPPLTAEQIWALKTALRHHSDQGDPIGVATVEPEIVGIAIAYAIEQSQEPSTDEVECFARTLCRMSSDAGEANDLDEFVEDYWQRWQTTAHAAIRAIRGLDAKKPA